MAKQFSSRLTEAKIKANRFYVGSLMAIQNGWGHATLQKATQHAGELLNAEQSSVHNDGEAVFIVKIVRIVRKKKAPVEIVEVR